MRPSPLVAALALLPACQWERGMELQDAQLEAAQIDTEVYVQDGSDAWEQAGRLSVTGAEQDWALSLAGETESWSFGVHSPATTVLSRFADTEVTLSLTTSWSGRPTGIAIADEADLAWAVWGADGNDALTARFGDDLVRYGEELEAGRADGMKYSWRAVSFQTDEGRVELAPGEVDDLRIDGALWRVTVIAAYQEEPLPGTAVPDCGGGGDLISFEIERVAEAAGSDSRSRPKGAEMAARSCG